LASFLIWKQARKTGLSEEKVFDVFLLTSFISLMAGRIGYVVSSWPNFSVDISRIFLVNHYPGMSFTWAFGAGIVTAILVAKSLDLEVWEILDIFTIGFGWAVVVGLLGLWRMWGLWGGLLVVAVGLTLAQYKIDTTTDLAPLARRNGIVTSAYLIFFCSCLLILGKPTKQEEVIFYLVLLVISLVFFMIKFPADVLQQIKKHLETKAVEAQARMKLLKKEDPFADKSRLLDRASDDADAQVKAGHERVEAMQRQMSLVLVQTRKALTKIKLGKYGVCESCGKMIDTDRLAAMPAATLCLICEKKREK